MGSSWYRHMMSGGPRWPWTSLLIILTSALAGIKRSMDNNKA